MRDNLALFRKQFNWRMLLVRFLLYAILILLVSALSPGIFFVNRTLVSWILVAAVFGLLLTVARPIIHVVTLPLMFVSYGLVFIVVNAFLLWLLARLMPLRFEVEGLWGALFGGLIIALLGGLLESLFGLNRPIVPDSEAELRARIRAQDRRVIYTLLTQKRPVGEPLPQYPEPALAAEALPAESAAPAKETPA
jgi:putative membrane protein